MVHKTSVWQWQPEDVGGSNNPILSDNHSIHAAEENDLVDSATLVKPEGTCKSYLFQHHETFLIRTTQFKPPNSTLFQ